MSSDCESIRAVVSFLVGKDATRTKDPTEAEVESAFRHLKWCRACRSTLTADERARFIHSAILERE